MTFHVAYSIYPTGNDKIRSSSETGSGFIVIPSNRKIKYNETSSSSPAYVGYVNAEIQNGTGVLYDLGVAVGNDNAKAVWQISKGWDAWLSYAISIIWQ